MALMLIHTIFYLVLTVMAGVLASKRGSVLGITLGSLLGGSMMLNFLGRIALFTPWALTNIGVNKALNLDLPENAMISAYITIALILLFTLISIRRFERTEL